MNEVLDYLKSCGIFYLATVEGDQPHVRPFGAICGFEEKLYLVTNNQKKVYAQMGSIPKIELCGMHKETWIRVQAEAVHDSRREARVAMMEDNKASLSSLYTVDDNLMEVLYLKNATATIYSFTSEPKVITF
ncbi:MAG: pyridoxamine 5'-phosphate oxidase family protein [Lachnospiraceae bacterium]|nr:pyridoxamine 5'-phosphate oxidase family protein [Lachnospiraceae bacterium]